MNIEKRLEYLISKRTELLSSINELNNELVKIQSKSISLPENAMIQCFKSSEIFDYLKTNKNKKIKVKMNECVIIESSLASDEHSYLYFNKSIKVNCISNTKEIRLLLSGDASDDVRPLVVFYDKNNRKISHEFFSFNIPIKFNLPDGADNFSIGFRMLGKTKYTIKSIEFDVSTLQDLADISYIEKISEKISELPESNGCRYYEKYKGNVGIIADRFLYDAYKDTCNCIYITPENYSAKELDLLIVASAWHGLNNEWDGMTKPDTENGKAVFEVIKYFKFKNVPIVFYSKEDPPNYDYFVHIAKECDFIFTSAAEMIDNYKRDCNTTKVDSLCFGINPYIHNPVGISPLPAKEGVIFSGSWMAKYQERIALMEKMFDGVLNADFSLKIIDRNYERNDPKYYFPQKYYSYVSPALEHDILQKVHKLYGWAININSVTESNTMFANRVYELQAIGNLLISNHSVGVEEKFNGVYIVNNSEQVKNILESTSQDEVYKKRIQNIRRVMTGETTFDRLNQVLNAVGIQYSIDNRKIAVVVKKITDELKHQFAEQTYKNRIFIEENEYNEGTLKDIDMIAFWSPEYQYGQHYLEDLSNGFKYTSCSYITKNSYFEGSSLIEGNENQYTQHCNKYNSIFWKKDFDLNELLSLSECFEHENGYSIDHFELIKLNGGK